MALPSAGLHALRPEPRCPPPDQSGIPRRDTCSLLLVVLLKQHGRGNSWPSAFVAALFAWHPLHVESVALGGRAQRCVKHLLLLAAHNIYICAHMCAMRTSLKSQSLKFEVGDPESRLARARVQGFKVQSPKIRNLLRFGPALFCPLGLMSKPMVVTLPFVLLLIDFWPLKRNLRWNYGFTVHECKGFKRRSEDQPCYRTFADCVLEKVPFFLLAAIISMAAYAVQKNQGVVVSVIPFWGHASPMPW